MRSKVLVVYYSAGGNTRAAAEAMAEAVKADILELVPKKKINVTGAGYLGWGIRQLVRKETCELEPVNCPLADYDLIVVGTPVWTYTLTPPVRTFLKENSFEGKRVAVFCCHGGNKGHTLEDLKSGMAGSICLGEIEFPNVPGQDKNEMEERAGAWIRALVER